MKKRITLFLSVLSVLGIFSIGNIHSLKAAEPSFNIEKAITAGDHKSLAEYYHAQANEQKKIAEMHQKMKTEYRDTHVHYKGYENAMAGHCNNLQLKAQEIADQYEELAKQEEKLIKK